VIERSVAVVKERSDVLGRLQMIWSVPVVIERIDFVWRMQSMPVVIKRMKIVGPLEVVRTLLIVGRMKIVGPLEVVRTLLILGRMNIVGTMDVVVHMTNKVLEVILIRVLRVGVPPLICVHLVILLGLLLVGVLLQLTQYIKFLVLQVELSNQASSWNLARRQYLKIIVLLVGVLLQLTQYIKRLVLQVDLSNQAGGYLKSIVLEVELPNRTSRRNLTIHKDLNRVMLQVQSTNRTKIVLHLDNLLQVKITYGISSRNRHQHLLGRILVWIKLFEMVNEQHECTYRSRQRMKERKRQRGRRQCDNNKIWKMH
jgi:hypothetical protein